MLKKYRIFVVFCGLAAALLLASCGQAQDEYESVAQAQYEAEQGDDYEAVQGDGYETEQGDGYETAQGDDYEEPLVVGRTLQPLILGPELSDVLEAANARREGIVAPDRDMLEELTTGRVPNISDWGRALEFWQIHYSRIVSLDDAISDVNAFFDFMYDVYGGYIYFGGDAVFNPVRQNIIDELTAIGTDIDPLTLKSTLYANLRPINNDRHFRFLDDEEFGIMRRDLGDFADFYSNPDLLFVRVCDGFVNTDFTTLSPFISVDGHDINDVFRLNLTYGGRLYYSPVIHILGEDNPDTYEIVVYREDGISQTLTLYKIADPGFGGDYVTMEYINDIPVITVPMMGFPYGEWYRDNALLFLEFAQEVRYEPVVIVDARGNRGGNGSLGTMWLYQLTGEIVPTNFVSISTLSYEIMTTSNPGEFYVGAHVRRRYDGFERFNNHTLQYIHPDRIIERDQLLIVLADRRTGSAGDFFVDSVFNVQNSLVIGTNTGGVINFNLTWGNLHLPISGLPFGIGSGMHVFPDGHMPEGIGVAPDLWVTGDSLAAALALIEGGVQ